jgi:hypothetical protein
VPCKAEARRSETPSDFQVVLSSAKKPSAPALASSASAAATERGLEAVERRRHGRAGAKRRRRRVAWEEQARGGSLASRSASGAWRRWLSAIVSSAT